MKTASFIFPWVFQDLRRGHGAVIIDAKGDNDFFEKIKAYHTKYNLDQELHYVNLGEAENSAKYNPLMNGTPQEINARLMTAFGPWSDEFYKSAAESSLLTVLQGLDAANMKYTFENLHDYLDEREMLEDLLTEIPESKDKARRRVQSLLNDFDDHKRNCQGLLNKIRRMADGPFSKIGDTKDPDVDLKQVYANNDVVYFGLSTNRFEDLARAFGKMLLLDLKFTGSLIDQNAKVNGEVLEKRFFPVFIDEFAEFVSEAFVGWLNKARSSGMAIHVAHQSLGDLDKLDSSLARQISDNMNLKMIFRVNDYETAETIAQQIGKRTVQKESESVMLGDQQRKGYTISEDEDFLIKPEIFLSNDEYGLVQGQAVVFGKHPQWFCNVINTDFLPDLSMEEAKRMRDEAGYVTEEQGERLHYKIEETIEEESQEETKEIIEESNEEIKELEKQKQELEEKIKESKNKKEQNKVKEKTKTENDKKETKTNKKDNNKGKTNSKKENKNNNNKTKSENKNNNKTKPETKTKEKEEKPIKIDKVYKVVEKQLKRRLKRNLEEKIKENEYRDKIKESFLA